MDAFSVVPPIAAILGAAVTKRIIPSLVVGLLAGAVIKSGGNPLTGAVIAGEYLSRVVADENHAYIILFLFGFGALAEMFKVGGGISGFAKAVDPYVQSEKGALLSVLLVTPVTFLDCCFHVISTGTISRPLLDKTGGSKEKLAFIINTTSSQLIVLIPFATTYLGYILGVTGSAMSQAGIAGSPYMYYLASLPFNFYSILMVVISLVSIFWSFNFSFFRLADPAYKKDLPEGDHDSHEAHEECAFAEKVPPRVANLLVPLALLLLMIIYLFWWTGQAKGANSLWNAMMNADYEKAIFTATLATIVFTAVIYGIQRIPMKELQSHFLSGGTEMLPPIVILIFAWAITGVTQDLGFNSFIGNFLANNFISRPLVPLVVFAVAGLASYFMGSSWGTWALVMPMALSLAATTDANVSLTIGAVLAGGSIGDNLSPLGETPVLTAAVTDLPLTIHVNYVLPYGVVAIALSSMLYLIAGFFYK
ncbi:Na+/H+ antiporter NhaC family protein [Anaeroselena agilis]|uniref:Na+/H+ antiporter NhaC family protein n=1 Tax=Anaeroselena agilis TaxID=3063788 RepID=A0ABU3P5J3_9FIRM|nr:Na+/H+ antiporter NhaC family protein [Selenomonadales bacterium 4137-cl]